MKSNKTFNYVADEMKTDFKPQLVKGRTGWVVKGLVYASLVGVGLMGINMTDTLAAEWIPNTAESIRAKIKEGDTSYTFVEGDTFYEIGRAINVKYTVLMELNGFEEGTQYAVPVGTTITFDGRKVTLTDKDGKVVNETVLSDDAKVDKSQPFMNQKSDTIKGTPMNSNNQSTSADNGRKSNKSEPVQPVTPVKPTNPTTPTKPVDPKPENNRLAELKRQLAELEAQLVIKQAELEDAFERLNEANAKINENSTILVNAQIAVNTLNEELVAAEAAVVTAQTKINDSQSAISAWQPTETETEIPASLKEALTNTQAELEAAQVSKESVLAKKVAADQALEEAKQLPEIDAVSIAEETSRINDEIQLLQQRIDEVKAEIATIEGNTKPIEDNKLEDTRQAALNTLGTLNLLPEELTDFAKAIKSAKSIEEITAYLDQASLAHDKNEAVGNEGKELKKVKADAITQLDGLNLSSEDKEILTHQINMATTIDEINEVLVHGKSISDENNQKEEAEKLKLESVKSETKKEMSSFNLTDKEQATFVSLVDNAKTVSEVLDALENARQVSNQNNQNEHKLLKKAKKEAIISLESLNLKEAEKLEFITQIQATQILSDIDSILKAAKVTSGKNDEIVNEKELVEAKNNAKQALVKMNLTSSQKTDFEKQINEATTISSINLIVANAQKESDKNDEESEETEKLVQVKEQAKKEVSALEYLPRKQKELISQSIDKAKSIVEINEIVTSAKKLDEQFKNDAESAKKLEETRQEALTELATLNLKGNTSFEEQIKKATTEVEISAILSDAKAESAKNNQEETEVKELQKAKKEAKVELANLNLTENQRTQYISQIEVVENMTALNEVIVAARATSKENDEKPAEKQSAYVEVKVMNTKFQVIDTITVEVELDENSKYEIDFDELGLNGYEFVSGYLTGTAQPGKTVKTTIRVQAAAVDLNSPEAISAMQEAFINRINEERASEGSASLTVLTDYNYIGEIRAEELITDFSHDRPDGSNYSTVFGDNGLAVSGGNGEVIFQVDSKGMSTKEIGIFAAKAFLNSPGHRKILMNSKYKYLILGFYTDGSTTGVVGIAIVNEPKPL